jgi:hypothetical protein
MDDVEDYNWCVLKEYVRGCIPSIPPKRKNIFYRGVNNGHFDIEHA